MRLALAIAPAQATPSAFVVFRDLLERSIGKAAVLGYDAVELALARADEVSVKSLRQVLDDCGVSVAAISTGRVFADERAWLSSPDKDVRDRAVSIVKGLVETAAALDSPRVSIGRVRGFVEDGEEPSLAAGQFTDALADCAGLAGEFGVDMVIEPVNRYEINLVNSVLPDGLTLVRRLGLPNVRLLADTFHMNIEDVSIEASLEASSDWIGYVQVADSNRWAPGQGHLDFPAIFATLGRIGYAGDIGVEILPLPTPDLAAAQAVEFLRPLLDQVSSIVPLADRGRAMNGRQEGVHQHTDAVVTQLGDVARRLRLEVLEMVYRAQTGHLGGSFSAAEIMAALYWHYLQIDPATPARADRDRFLLSKGHAAPLLYATLAHRGFFPIEELETFREFPTRLEGHPDRKLPGVEMAAGPLGHGLAVGVGVAWALSRSPHKPSARSAPSRRASLGGVVVLLGDGELDAGVVWEGAMAATKFGLGNLTAIVDVNGVQQTGATVDVMPLGRLAEKWAAFGWHVQEVHGHNTRELIDALERTDDVHGVPSVILARTTKGRGVSFMEYDYRWHGRAPTAEEYEQARRELTAEGVA